MHQHFFPTAEVIKDKSNRHDAQQYQVDADFFTEMADEFNTMTMKLGVRKLKTDKPETKKDEAA